MIKYFINHFSIDEFKHKCSHLEHLDLSIFVDATPKSHDELSQYNILILQEPNEYFGLHDWAIQNQHIFSLILTWSDIVLNKCNNAYFTPFGGTWFKPEQYEKNHEKQFQVSHLCGKLLKTYGQSIRHEVLARESEIKSIPTKFFHTYGDRYDIENARIGKEEVFANSQYGIAIENTSHRGYFTEKILDCFLLKTIPIYWGCSNIEDFFDDTGIIKVNNADDIIYVLKHIPTWNYNLLNESGVIENNYQKALKFIDYPQNIVDKITEIFTFNKLI